MAVLDNSDNYVVAVNTPVGPAIIESPEQWGQMERVAEYLGLLNRNRVGKTNKVYVSAIISNTPEDAEREVQRPN